MTAQDIKSMPEFQALVLAVEALHQRRDFTIALFCDGSGEIYEADVVGDIAEDGIGFEVKVKREVV